MKRYTITIYRNGRARIYRFATLHKAQACAREIFKRTGAIVGIEVES